MKILCTHPGKFGDLLWSLPTARAISEAYGVTVDFLTSPAYSSILPLVAAQPYIGEVRYQDAWEVHDTAPMTPREPPQAPDGTLGFGPYDRIFHLGYPTFPSMPLAQYVYETTKVEWKVWQQQSNWADPTLPPLDLDRPWITIDGPGQPTEFAITFSDEWFELKFGIAVMVDWALRYGPSVLAVCAPESRWNREFVPGVLPVQAMDWLMTARTLRNADHVLTCLSSQWVLANALGKDTIVVEPSKMRWDSPGGWRKSIFWRESPKNHMVLGNDGLPTFDARAVVAAVREILGR